VATVTAPPTGGPWEQYRLTVCVEGTTTCLPNVPLCPIVAGVEPTSCPIPGATPFTNYTVVAVALKPDGSGGTTESPPSNVDPFQTRIECVRAGPCGCAAQRSGAGGGWSSGAAR
jgi:hypothetical protein